MGDTIKLLRGNKANLPTLKEGEPGFCMDTEELFIGTQNGNSKVSGKKNDSISPDDYTGSDLVKVQSALNDAKTLNRSIKLDRLYNITGGTLVIDNPDGINRTPVYIFGVNKGGLKKDDSGFMFTAPSSDHGDISINNVYFVGIAGSGMRVFDCDKLIRIGTHNCFFKNVDTVLYTSDTRYLQSIRMIQDTIIGGQGFVIDIAGAYDMRLDQLLVEARQGFFNHRHVGTHKYITSSSMQNCTVEGLSGKTMVIGSTKSFDVSFNYFELNNEVIEFLPGSEVIGFNFLSNGYYGNLIASTCFVKWAGTIYGAKSENNVCGDFPIHDVTGITSGKLLSINDGYSVALLKYTGPSGNIVITRPNNYKTHTTEIDGVNGYTNELGNFKRLVSVAPSFTLTAGEIRLVTVPFLENIYQDDIISVHPNLVLFNDKILIAGTMRNGKDVYVKVKNEEAVSKTVNSIVVTVLKPKLTGTILG